MAEACPLCRRPRLTLPHNAETAGPTCFGEGSGDCLRFGIAQRDATIRAQDELLGRARAVLVDVGRQLNDAFERLGGA